jgi:hypothetical protein
MRTVAVEPETATFGNGNQTKWFTAFRHPPSPGYGGTRRTGHEEVTRDEWRAIDQIGRWKLNESVHNPQVKALQIGSPARYALTR